MSSAFFGSVRILHQRGLVQIAQNADDRQAADKFGDQAVTDQVAGLHLFEQFDVAALAVAGVRIGVEAQRFRRPARLSIDLFKAHESAAADEQNVGRVDRREFLVRMLAAALRRNVGDGAFENLQQRLLHAFAGNIAGDRRVLVLLGDLVDLIDIDDALLRLVTSPSAACSSFRMMFSTSSPT